MCPDHILTAYFTRLENGVTSQRRGIQLQAFSVEVGVIIGNEKAPR
jgi:hypothetical protein